MNLTRVVQQMPWGLYSPTGHRVLCADGVVRAARMAQTPDTFFSIPASVRIRGKHVSGFVTTEDRSLGGRVWCFHHHTRTDDLLPPWPASWEPAYDALLAKAFEVAP